MKYKSLLDIPFRTAEIFPDRISHKDNRKDNPEPVKYSEFTGFIRVLTAGFKYYGIQKKDHAAFL